MDLMEEMQAKGVPANTITYNAAISTCAKQGKLHAALKLIEDMKTSRVPMNTITINAAISICQKGGQWQQALQLIEYAEQNRVAVDTITYNAAISTCKKGGHWQQAVQLMADMKAKGVPPDTITYSSIIGVCGKGGQLQLALNFMEEMQAKNIPPNTITYNQIMRVCAAGGQGQYALTLLDEAKSKKVPLDLVTYKAAIGACGKGGQREQAAALIKEMQDCESSAGSLRQRPGLYIPTARKNNLGAMAAGQQEQSNSSDPTASQKGTCTNTKYQSSRPKGGQSSYYSINKQASGSRGGRTDFPPQQMSIKAISVDTDCWSTRLETDVIRCNSWDEQLGGVHRGFRPKQVGLKERESQVTHLSSPFLDLFICFLCILALKPIVPLFTTATFRTR